MSKEDFLQRLRQALAGEVPQSVIQENIRYYDEYISGEMQRGLSAEEVTAGIGDPRLIARTIIDATPGGGEGDPSYHSSTQSGGSYSYSGEPREEPPKSRSVQSFQKIFNILAVVVVVFLVITVVGGLFSLIMPILGPFLMIMFIFWIIRGPRGPR